MEPWLKDYYGQHARLGELAVRLQKGLEDGQDEAALISVLAELMAVLRLHLALEDHVLYPVLRQSQVAGVSAKAKQFQDEMGSLLPVVVGFIDRWYSVNAVRENAAVFQKEAAGLLEALFTRVRRENQELYPMAEGARI